MKRRNFPILTMAGLFMACAVLCSSSNAQSYCPSSYSGEYNQVYSTPTYSSFPTYSYSPSTSVQSFRGTTVGYGQYSGGYRGYSQGVYYVPQSINRQPVQYRNTNTVVAPIARSLPSPPSSSFGYRSSPPIFSVPSSPYCFGGS